MCKLSTDDKILSSVIGSMRPVLIETFLLLILLIFFAIPSDIYISILKVLWSLFCLGWSILLTGVVYL